FGVLNNLPPLLKGTDRTNLNDHLRVLVIMPRPLPAHLAGADIKKTILDTAERLLATRGYRDLTMDKLADEMGIAKGTTYLYFASKESVALGVIERSVLKVFDALEKIAAGSGSAESKLRELIVARV